MTTHTSHPRMSATFHHEKLLPEANRYFFESSPAINIIVDGKGLIVAINRAFTETLGYTEDEAVGRPAVSFVPEDKQENAANLLRRTLNNDDPGEIFLDLQTKDGRIKTIFFPGTKTETITDRDGTVYLPLSAIDVTSLAAAQKEIALANHRLTDIFNGAGDGIVYIDTLNHIVDVNPAFCRLFDIDREALIGRNPVDIIRTHFGCNEAERMRAILDHRRVMKDKMTYEFSAKGTTIEITVPAGRTESGGLTILVRDISDRKAFEASLALQTDLSLALNEITDLDTALTLILDRLLTLKDFDGGGIYIYNPDTRRLVLTVTKGIGLAFIESVKEYGPETPQYQMVRAGNPLYLHYKDLKHIFNDTGEGIRAIASFPILHHGEPVAAINLTSHLYDEIAPWTRRTVEIVGAQLGGVIDRLRTETLLARSEVKFRSLFSNMVDCVVYFRIVYDPSGKPVNLIFEDINETYERMIGKKKEKVIGKMHTEVFRAPSENWKAAIERVRRVDATGKGERYEFYASTTGRWFAGSTVSPQKGYIVNVIKDITERKATEARLRESEERFRRLAEASQEGIIILDGDIIIDCNEAYERIFNASRAEIIGSSTLNFTAPESRETVHTVVRNNVESTYEGVGLRGDGVKINTLVTGKHIPYLGKIVRIAAIRDITSFKQAEQRISASLEEKEVLLREIHHRVKNNLQVITSLLMLQADRISDPVNRAMFTVSIDRVRAMAIIHEMLYNANDLAKIGAAEYIRRICDNLASAYIAHPSRIATVISIGDISLGLDTAIPCGLIVNELVSNALKHGLREKNEGVVKVIMRQKNGLITLRVSDNGIGIPADFDWKNTDSLGLKIVRLLAERQLGGSIKLGARKKGTTFIITFPDHTD